MKDSTAPSLESQIIDWLVEHKGGELREDGERTISEEVAYLKGSFSSNIHEMTEFLVSSAETAQDVALTRMLMDWLANRVNNLDWLKITFEFCREAFREDL